MIKIFVYAANKERAEESVQTLKSAGAEHVELLESLKLSARQSKENRYLFICKPPAEKLASLVQNELPESQYAEDLGQWYTTQHQILAAYQSKKKRALLITTSTLVKEKKFISLINDAWDLNLNSGKPSQVEIEHSAESDTLLAYLVQNLLKQNPLLLKLSDSIAQGTDEKPDCVPESEAIAAYRNLKRIKSGYKQESESAKKQLKKLNNQQEESQLFLSQLHQVQGELERVYLEYKYFKESAKQEVGEISAARDHHAHVAYESAQEIGRLKQEISEISAARDHHAHVAYESAQEIGRLKQEISEISAARDHHAHVAYESAQEIGRLKQEISEISAARDHHAHVAYESAQEIGRLKQEISEISAARDHHAHVAYESAQEIGRLKQEISEISSARDHHAHVVHRLEDEIGHLHKEKEGIAVFIEEKQANTRNLQQEAKVLLQKLQQAQEELERNFHELQEVKNTEQQRQIRWERIFRNNTELFDCESIKVTPIDGEVNSFKWAIQGLEAASLSRSAISFETFVESGVLGIRFRKEQEDKRSGLTRWPHAAKELTTVELIPAGNGNTKLMRASILGGLSASDWQLAKFLPLIILKNIPDQEKYSDAIGKFRKGLEIFPAVFRYDEIVLKRELRNTDYEHLWLVLNSASFGKYNWKKFETRVSASNVSKNKFFLHPKLEIPLIDGKYKPFDSWFEESVDSFGGKYELRFDIINQRADTNAWSKLNAVDKKLILGIIKESKEILKRLRCDKITLQGDWDNWEKLLSAMNICSKSLR